MATGSSRVVQVRPWHIAGRLAALAALVLGGAVMAAGPVAAGGFDTLRVAEAITLDSMTAGPGRSALLLSPDGGTLVHFARKQVCIHDLSGGAPVLRNCLDIGTPPGGLAGLTWSPDGTRLSWPDRGTALATFRDTDVTVLDLSGPTLSVLTGDGYEGSLQDSPAPLDLVAGWREADSLVFLRQVRPGKGALVTAPAALMAVQLDGKVTEILPSLGGDGTPLALAVAEDRMTTGVYLDSLRDKAAGGLFVYRSGEGEARHIAPGTAFPARPAAIAFSADERFVLAMTPGPKGFTAVLVDLVEATVTPFMPGETLTGAGWSPSDAALAYTLATDPKTGKEGGLYLSDPAGTPGRLLHPGTYIAPHCCTGLLEWARNDTMVLGNSGTFDRPFLLRFAR